MGIVILFKQISKRIFLGIVSFLTILSIVTALDFGGLYTVAGLIGLIFYPNLFNRTLSKFFSNELHKLQFLIRLHFVLVWLYIFTFMGSYYSFLEGRTDLSIPYPYNIYIPYSLIVAVIFIIKKQKFLKRGYRILRVFLVFSLICFSIQIYDYVVVKDILRGGKGIYIFNKDKQIFIELMKKYLKDLEKIQDEFWSVAISIREKLFTEETLKSEESINSTIKQIDFYASLIDKYLKNYQKLHKDYINKIKLSNMSDSEKEWASELLDQKFSRHFKLADNFCKEERQFLTKSKELYEFLSNNYPDLRIINGVPYFDTSELTAEYNSIKEEVNLYYTKSASAIKEIREESINKISNYGITQRDIEEFFEEN